MTEIRQHATEIHDQLPDDASTDLDEIVGRLDTLVNEYKVPIEEARRSVVSHYTPASERDRDARAGGNPAVDVVDIDAAEQWVDLNAKVVELWEPRSDAVAQVGLLGDETGTIKFTAWAKSDLPELDEGRVYRLENLVTDEYQGRYSVKLNRTTTIEAVDEEIEVGDNKIEREGALVAIQSGSGLIKRCPEADCTRVLQNGRCSEHGEGEGEFDLRIKGVLDDGITVQELIFDQEATERLTGFTLKEAKDRAMDALDTSVIADEIRDATLGRYYRVEGPEMGRYLLVNEAEPLAVAPSHEELLIKARSH